MIRKKILTTGQVAKICSVAPRTVSKWFDSGQLKGYRIPGSRDRRIPISELIRFMKEYDMPALAHFSATVRVLIAQSDPKENLGKQIQDKRDYEVEVAKSDFEIGTAIHKFMPHLVLIDVRDKNIDSDHICEEIGKKEELQGIKMIAISDNAKNAKINTLLQKGYDSVITDSSDIDEIIKKIDQSLAIVY